MRVWQELRNAGSVLSITEFKRWTAYRDSLSARERLDLTARHTEYLKECFRVRVEARKAIAREIKAGRMKSAFAADQPCAYCNSPIGWIWEHRNYYEPLNVKPACDSCNRRLGPGHPVPVKLERFPFMPADPLAAVMRGVWETCATAAKGAA